MGWQDAPIVEESSIAPASLDPATERGNIASRTALFNNQNPDDTFTIDRTAFQKGTPKDITSIPETSKWQDAPSVEETANWKSAPEVTEEEQKPWFSGDPTAGIANWVKKKGTDIADNPMKAITGAVAGLAGAVAQVPATIYEAIEAPGKALEGQPTKPSDIWERAGKTTNKFMQGALEGLGGMGSPSASESPVDYEKLSQDPSFVAGGEAVMLATPVTAAFLAASKGNEWVTENVNKELGATGNIVLSLVAPLAMAKVMTGKKSAALKEIARKPEAVDALARNLDTNLRSATDKALGIVEEPRRSLVEEPAIAEGTVRLYRGQVEGKAPGKWFSTDKETAAPYGDLHYVDVPEIVAAVGMENTGTKGIRLPPEWAEKTTFLSKEEKLPVYEVTEGTTPIANLTDQINKFTMYKLADLLRESVTKEEFLTRAGVLKADPYWKDYIAEYADRLWNEPEKIIKAFGVDKTYEAMNPVERKLTASGLSVDDFMELHKKDTLEQYRKEGLDPTDVRVRSRDDLKVVGTSLAADTQLAMIKADTISGKILKFVIEKGREYTALKDQLLGQWIQVTRPYEGLPRKNRENVMDTRIHFNRVEARENLRRMGLQWPTKEMLIERGLSEPEVLAYEALTKGADQMMDLLNQALAKEGQSPLTPIPGYMPQFYEGTFRVLVKTMLPDGKEFVSLVVPFETRQGALKLVKELNEGKRDDPTTGIKYRPDIEKTSGLPYRVRIEEGKTQGFGETLQEQLTAYKNLTQLEPSIISKLEKLENDAQRGNIKHVLERSENVHGWLGEMGIKDTLPAKLGMSHSNNRLLLIDQEYAKAVLEYYKNTMFMNEVGSRLYNHTMVDSPKKYYGDYLHDAKDLRTWISKYTGNFTGENYNHIKWFDSFFQRAFLKVGLPPQILSTSVGHLRDYLSILRLRGNPGYYISNAVQPAHVLSILSLTNELQRQQGMPFKITMPLRAVGRTISNWNNPELKASRAWAKDQGIIGAQLEAQVRTKSANPVTEMFHTITGIDDFGAKLEGFSRNLSFSIAHEFFKDTYKGDSTKVRAASQKVMEMVMVNYDRSSRPLMYQNLGVVSSALSPFAVFRNSYMGNMALMAKAIHSGKASPLSFMPLISTQIMFLLTGGSVGLFMVQELDLMVKMWNKIAPDAHLPSATEMFMKVAPNWMTFGLLSSATRAVPGLEEGVYFGSSMNAPGFDLEVPLASFVTDIAALGTAGIHAAGHAIAPDKVNPVSMGDVYKPMRSLAPGLLRGPIESIMTPKRDVALSQSGEGYVNRTEAGWNSLNWLGRTSIDENQRRAIEQAVKSMTLSKKANNKEIVSQMVDILDGIPTQADASELTRRALDPNEGGYDGESFNKAVFEEYEKRRTTVKQRDAAGESNEAYRRRNLRYRME